MRFFPAGTFKAVLPPTLLSIMAMVDVGTYEKSWFPGNGQC